MIYSSNPSKAILKKKNIFLKKINKILTSNSYIKGSELDLFEKKFAKYIGTKYSIGVANGTDALELSLKSLNLNDNDEIITVSHTSPATITAIINSRLKPVLIDVDKDSYNIDINKIKSNISLKTKGIVSICITLLITGVVGILGYVSGFYVGMIILGAVASLGFFSGVIFKILT